MISLEVSGSEAANNSRIIIVHRDGACRRSHEPRSACLSFPGIQTAQAKVCATQCQECAGQDVLLVTECKTCTRQCVVLLRTDSTLGPARACLLFRCPHGNLSTCG